MEYQNLAARPDASQLRKRKGKNAMLFLIIEIAVGVLILGALLFVLTRTGLLRYPGSSLFYQPPVPSRIVQTSSVLTPDDLANLMENREPEIKTPIETTYVTEQELTSAFRGIVRPVLSQSGLGSSLLQVAVLPGQVEVVARVTKSFLHFDLLMRARIVTDGITVRFDPTRLQIGQWQVSRPVFNWLLRQLSGRDLDSLAFTFRNRLRSIMVSPGRIDITFDESPVSP